MTEKNDSNQSVSLTSWWSGIFRHASLIPKFQFMVHDRWSNVLFLHWRVPSHLEATLEAHTSPFAVERHDGSAWIGLILLTEEAVGPSFGRSPWTCVTHNGINVRTYVRGVNAKAKNDDTKERQEQQLDTRTTRGIHFSSLECDDEFTSFGANVFGMPYRVAEMKRTFTYGNGQTTNGANKEDHKVCHYTIRSKRLPSGDPSFLRILYRALNYIWPPRILHSATTSKETTNNSDIQTSKIETEDMKSSDMDPLRFSVECRWSRYFEEEKDATNQDPFHDWAAERYCVYTHKYGRNWRGRVDHEPWPVDAEPTIRLASLRITGVEAYEPSAMRPILRHMADHKPDRVGFSKGVGPVTFTMLQPV